MISKSKVAPIKKLTIPRLELCGAYFLSQLLHHVKEVYQFPLKDIYAWTDSTIVLSWLIGNLRCFKIYVNNWVSSIIKHIPPDHWDHVHGVENPADHVSRGLMPSQLLDCRAWLEGPPWLNLLPFQWPQQLRFFSSNFEEERDICHLVLTPSKTPVISPNRYSNFTFLKHITAWILCFVNDSQLKDARKFGHLAFKEMILPERYWISLSQEDLFAQEIAALKSQCSVSQTNHLLPLNPFVDSSEVFRVGGREQHSNLLIPNNTLSFFMGNILFRKWWFTQNINVRFMQVQHSSFRLSIKGFTSLDVGN